MPAKILRDPLFHFLLLGAALFVAFGLLNAEPDGAPQDVATRITITAQDIAGLERGFQSTWRRPPDDAERQALIDAYIRQEVLVREAIELGLDRNDSVIRQRLQQKMNFLLSAGANALEPTDAELLAHMAEDPTRYQRPARMAFDQVFLGTDPAQGDIEAARSALRGGAAAGTLGQPTLLPAEVALAAAPAIDSLFGSGFAAARADLGAEQASDQWGGPVQSGYGLHLVRLRALEPAQTPPLEEMRDRVEAGWRAARAEALTERLYQELRGRFQITVEGQGI